MLKLIPIDRYLAGTHHLSFAEHGAYLRLMLLAWTTSGLSLPDDPAWIARRLSISREEFEQTVAPVLAEFFTRRNGRIYPRRVGLGLAKDGGRAEAT